jgi:hypothetical protein
VQWDGSGNELVSLVRQFIDNLQTLIESTCESELLDIAREGLDAQLTEEEVYIAVCDAVRRQVETEVYLPLAQNITHVLSKEFAAEEQDVQERIARFKGMPQSFFGISGITLQYRALICVIAASTCTTFEHLFRMRSGYDIAIELGLVRARDARGQAAIDSVRPA